MNVKNLLEKGYFPKELPPPFTTSKFAEKSRYILSKTARYSTSPKFSKSALFSLSKGRYSRRSLEIPNPKQYLELSKFIASNWKKIRPYTKISPYSESTPVEYQAKRSLRTKSKSLNDFRFKLLQKSFNKKYELRFDISLFYPSIYTHSLTWAIMGKEDAKEYFKKRRKKLWRKLVATDRRAQLYEFCNEFDKLLRNCKEQQSIGIPIGPDGSFLVAELIANRMDLEISEQISDIIGSRYFDDYYFYVDSYTEAEIILKKSQKIINDFNLEINDNKVTIEESPHSFENEWANILSSFRFKDIDAYELRTFFDIVYKLLKRFPKQSDQVVHYALQRFEYGHVPIKKEGWDTFLQLTLNLQMFDPSNLDQFLKILLSYRAYIRGSSIDRIKSVLEKIVSDHTVLNHSFEVSWALWIMISFKITCKNSILKQVLESNDNVSKLICLDLMNKGLCFGRPPGTSHIFKTFSREDLYNEQWLFIYESIKKKWLPGASSEFLNSDPFMNELNQYDVEFYNPLNQIELEFEDKIQPDPDLSELFDTEEIKEKLPDEPKSKY